MAAVGGVRRRWPAVGGRSVAGWCTRGGELERKRRVEQALSRMKEEEALSRDPFSDGKESVSSFGAGAPIAERCLRCSRCSPRRLLRGPWTT